MAGSMVALAHPRGVQPGSVLSAGERRGLTFQGSASRWLVRSWLLASRPR